MNNPSTCPHFSNCSGCTVANFLKPPIWTDALNFYKSHEVIPEFISDGFEGIRYKAKLAVRPGPFIGLFKKNSHEVMPIPNCLVHHPSINRAIDIIKKEMVREKLSAYSENSSKGTLRYLQLFVEKSTGLVQLVLVINQREGISSFCERLKKYDLWHSIWLNVQKGSTNQILGDFWEHNFGKPFLWQKINGKAIPFHPGAFSQAHLPLFEKMLQTIENWVKPEEKVIELYAGVGVIGLNLEKKTKSITLVENNPFAHISFLETGSNIPYLLVDAKEVNLSSYDLIIVDPPRKGLDATMIPRMKGNRLIYISCGFESFKRDAEKLISLGWKIKEAKCFLLFPGSNHVETVTLFER